MLALGRKSEKENYIKKYSQKWNSKLLVLLIASKHWFSVIFQSFAEQETIVIEALTKNEAGKKNPLLLKYKTDSRKEYRSNTLLTSNSACFARYGNKCILMWVLGLKNH